MPATDSADRVADDFWTTRTGIATIYKICLAARWRKAEIDGEFCGSGIDYVDGYIHFSTGAQVAETTARHFAAMDNLMLIAVDADRLGAAVKWEPARSGDLFPHLYESLPLAAVLWAVPLPRGKDGRHRFPVLAE